MCEVKLMVSPLGGVRFTATANGLQQKKGLSNCYFSCPIRTVIALYYVKLEVSQVGVWLTSRCQ